MERLISLTDRHITQLQDEGRIVVEGYEIRMEGTDGVYKVFSTTAESIAEGNDVDPFVSTDMFCVVDDKSDNQDGSWYVGADMGGSWIIARMRQQVENPEIETRDPYEIPSMNQSTATETYTRLNFFEGKLEREPEESEEFVEYIYNWMFPPSFDSNNSEHLTDGVCGGPNHNLEEALDTAFAGS